jgi:hypothetical protein
MAVLTSNARSGILPPGTNQTSAPACDANPFGLILQNFFGLSAAGG